MLNKKKILNVVSVYFSVPFFFGDQLKYFKLKGYDIHLVCSPSDKIEEYAYRQGVKFKEFTILRKISLLQDVKTVFALYNYIKKNNFDIVVGHTPKGALIAMLASFLARTQKRIFFRHGLVYETKTGVSKQLLINIERFTSLLSTTVVCVSPYLVNKSISDRLTSKKKLKLLNIGSCNGVDVLAKFKPINILQEKVDSFKFKFNISEEKYVIGYVGRLVKDKGIAELVNSFINLKLKYNHIKLLLVGPYEDKDGLSDDIRNVVKNDCDIITVGHIDDDIEYYYSLMNVFILPTHREGLGTSILEASSMCLPVLTAGHTGSRDAIIDGFTGSYIKIDALDIGEKLEKYIVNPNLYIQQGINGRNHMIKNFRQELIWDEIEKTLYQ
jgi:glycosyltransferase involved in cell wall biosynthesis